MTSSKSIELRLAEASQLLKHHRDALARERGGGTPLSIQQYRALLKDTTDWLKDNDPEIRSE